MDFWVYESSLCIREVPKLSFGIKSEVNGKWFSRVSLTVAFAYHEWMPAITCQEAVISSLRSFFRSILHSFLEIQFENPLKKYKNGHFRAKIGVLGDWKFNWKIQLVMSRLYNQANENHYSIFWCFGTLDEGQKWILLVQSFIVQSFRGLKTGRLYYDQVHSYLHHG